MRPPYATYLLERRDHDGGLLDFDDTYDKRIWCRTSDRMALLRTARRGRTIGSLDGETIGFDGIVDPGPPTADIFERAVFSSPGQLPPPPDPFDTPAPLNFIGAVHLRSEHDYRVVNVRREGPNWVLRLEPKRDPRRNRLDELWVDADTYVVRRAQMRDHMYYGLTQHSIADEFDITFSERDGLPLITAIHGIAENGHETDYTYKDIEFPSTLPDWYFDPKTYGNHRTEMPT